MSIVSLLVTLIVVGIVLYLINLIPMDPTMKKIVHAVALIAVVLWLLESFGFLGGYWVGPHHR